MKKRILPLLFIFSLLLAGCGSNNASTAPIAYDASAEAPTEDGSYISIINGMGIDVDAKYNLYNSDGSLFEAWSGSYAFCGFQREVEFVEENDDVLVLSGYIQDDYFISTEPHNVNYIKDDGFVDYAELPEGTEVYVKPIYPLSEKDILAAGLDGRYRVDEEVIIDDILKLDYHVDYIELNAENVAAIELSPEGFTFSSDCDYTGAATFTLADGRKIIGTISFFYMPGDVSNIDDYQHRLAQEIYWAPSGSHEILVEFVE